MKKIRVFGLILLFAMVLTITVMTLYEKQFSNGIKAEPEVFSSPMTSQVELFLPNPRMPLSILIKEEVQAPQESSLSANEGRLGEEYVLITTSILRVRSGPTVNSDIVWKFRKGMLLKAKKIDETPEEIWYGLRVAWLGCKKYPERFPPPETWWYFAQKYNNEELAKIIQLENIFSVLPETKPKEKWIQVFLSQQKLEAYENKKMVFSTSVSTGVDDSPTLPGNFRISKKEMSVCMQGPLTEFGFTDKYDLPGIGWAMYFTSEGAALHGTYWHQNFGRPHSHGCINLKNESAKWLYSWALEGTKIIIRE